MVDPNGLLTWMSFLHVLDVQKYSPMDLSQVHLWSSDAEQCECPFLLDVFHKDLDDEAGGLELGDVEDVEDFKVVRVELGCPSLFCP